MAATVAAAMKRKRVSCRGSVGRGGCSCTGFDWRKEAWRADVHRFCRRPERRGCASYDGMGRRRTHHGSHVHPVSSGVRRSIQRRDHPRFADAHVVGDSDVSLWTVRHRVRAGRWWPAWEQDPPQALFRSSVDLVSMAAIVRDKRGKIVPSLKREDFEVFDAGKRRPMLDLRTESAAPASVALLVDGTGSMKVGSADALSQRISGAILEPG